MGDSRHFTYIIEESLSHRQIVFQFRQFVEVSKKSIGVRVDLFQFVIEFLEGRFQIDHFSRFRSVGIVLGIVDR